MVANWSYGTNPLGLGHFKVVKSAPRLLQSCRNTLSAFPPPSGMKLGPVLLTGSGARSMSCK